jgi:hypothetical protein
MIFSELPLLRLMTGELSVDDDGVERAGHNTAIAVPRCASYLDVVDAP